jgi:hypothetical protein
MAPRLLVTSTLDQNFEHVAVLIYGSPQIVMLALDRQSHFVHLPLVAGLRTAATKLIGILPTKLAAPFTDGFIGDLYSTFRFITDDLRGKR